MSKIVLVKPTLITLYGMPGAGKSYFARQLCDSMHAVHVSSDRIRGELFETPRYDKEENSVVAHLMEYMTEEFLKAGVSVVFDNNAQTAVGRRELRELARRLHAAQILIWLQIDRASALARVLKRDRRRLDDKYARDLDKKSFDEYITAMQNPKKEVEDYIVLSGKHSFPMQRSSLVRKMYELNLINADNVSNNVVKPGLVNLVPGRGDLSQRNIMIR